MTDSKQDDAPKELSRRKAMTRIGLAALGAGGAVAVARGSHLTDSTTPATPIATNGITDAPTQTDLPPWTLTPGRPLREYGQPSVYESDVVRIPTKMFASDLASQNYTPLQSTPGIITASGLHYERNHGSVPDIDPNAHRLIIHGMVKRPVVLTMEDIKRYPSVTRIHFLECSGNTVTEIKKPTAPDVQRTHGLLSCAEWTGVSTAVILESLGVDPEAKWAVAEGADSAALDRSIPVEKLWGDAMLVYAQNGEMLRPSQGYPLRLLLPGYEGNMNIKWIRRLKFMRDPVDSYQETAYYTELMKDGKARQFNFIMEAKSVITFPSGGQRLADKGYHEITGLAWSGRGKIVRVEVSVDGGSSWQQAQLQEPVLSKCLTRFRLNWVWNGEPAVLQSRCIDEVGGTQPTIAELVAKRGTHFVYHNNAIQSWKVNEDGEVVNVHA